MSIFIALLFGWFVYEIISNRGNYFWVIPFVLLLINVPAELIIKDMSKKCQERGGTLINASVCVDNKLILEKY